MVGDFLQKIAHRTHVNGVGEGAVSIRLTTSLHEKRPVAVTRQALFPDLSLFPPKKCPVFSDYRPLLKRNALDFPIWACFSEETRQNSRFRRVAKKKRAGILDLGVLLRRNTAEFSI